MDIIRACRPGGLTCADQGSDGSGGQSMIVAMAASVVLVVTTILILYETLRLTSNHVSELALRPRARIIAVVLATFIGHTAAVWTYALAYWVLAAKWQVGGFAGVEGFQDCLYF